MSSIIRYPVDLKELGPSEYSAVLVDLPHLSPGHGATPEAAYNDLADRAIPAITELMLKGDTPDASDAPDNVPVIGISPPMAIKPPGPDGGT